MLLIINYGIEVAVAKRALIRILVSLSLAFVLAFFFLMDMGYSTVVRADTPIYATISVDNAFT